MEQHIVKVSAINRQHFGKISRIQRPFCKLRHHFAKCVYAHRLPNALSAKFRSLDITASKGNHIMTMNPLASVIKIFTDYFSITL